MVRGEVHQLNIPALLSGLNGGESGPYATFGTQLAPTAIKLAYP